LNSESNATKGASSDAAANLTVVRLAFGTTVKRPKPQSAYPDYQGEEQVRNLTPNLQQTGLRFSP